MNNTNTAGSTCSSSSSSSSNKKAAATTKDATADVVVLECGSSLAEQEHHQHQPPPLRLDDNAAAAAADNIREHELLFGLVSSENKKKNGSAADGGISTVDDLRSAIASDVLTGGNVVSHTGQQQPPYTTLTSPFAIPKQRQQLTTNGQSQNNNRFLDLPLIYCDQTASNRPIQSIERYIQHVCLPYYGNTHTNTSITGAQSTAFCAEARQIVAEETNAKITGKASCDVVLFTGNGATSAVELLIDCLGLKHHVAAAAAVDNKKNHRPIVFVGPYEHHSNLIIWRETGCQIIQIPQCSKTNNVDLIVLERQLQYYQQHYPNTLKMGTFTAASNVTGKLCDTLAIAALLHHYNALAFFDYATAAPYATSRFEMNMNPTIGPTLSSDDAGVFGNNNIYAKDAMFISPHKIIGGSSGTPGILIIKKKLISQVNAPNKAGGGTVFYVTHDHHRFLSNRIERYEGGTPHVIGIIRIGLTFLYKRQIEQQYTRIVAEAATANTSYTAAGNDNDNGTSDDNEDKDNAISSNQHSSSSSSSSSSLLLPRTIFDHDCMTHQRVVSYLTKHAPNLILLGIDNNNYGNNGVENGSSISNNHNHNKHLPIFSFLIQWRRRFLHFNYVSAILNDLFGIQSRGGCQCAGPYSQSLLGLTEMVSSSSSSSSTLTKQQGQQQQEMPNARNKAIEAALVQYKERAELLRPGYTRISLPFKGLHSFEIDYVLKALVWVSKHAWELMPQYRVNHRTGEWRHYNRQGKPLGPERRWLSHVDFFEGEASSSSSSTTSSTTTTPMVDLQTRLDQALEDADFILQDARSDQKNIVQALKMTDAEFIMGGGDDAHLEELRWHVYPKECADAMTKTAINNNSNSGSSDSNISSSYGPLLGALNPDNTGVSHAFVTRHVDDQLKGTGLPSASIDDNDDTQTNTVAEKEGSSGDDAQLLFFRDGEHSGEAPLFEIKSGWEEGELSDTCQVFSPESGEWVSIPSFIGSSFSSKSQEPPHPKEVVDESKDERVSTFVEKVVFFRDGEHSGEAPLSEIKSGLDEGELSDACHVYDTESGEWLLVQSFLESDSSNIPAGESGAAVENGNKTSATVKEETFSKKEPRDSASWGRGNIVSTTTQSSTTGSYSEQKTDGKRHASPMLTTPGAVVSKKARFRHVKPPPKMMRLVTQAIVQWEMLKEGDRLLLGLSGGKDSLSLLHCLLEFQRKLPIKFEIEVCTIDPMTPSFSPAPLIPYVESLGLKYHYIRDDIVARANSAGKGGKMVSSLCAFCARMKRGNLYAAARKNKCNKLVLAQHLDDCAESFMMSVMHNGFLRTMKANYQIEAGDISVIRPLVYCRESLMSEFAKSANLPVINENCPACFEEPKERARVKKLLSREELNYPNFYDNIRRSLMPLMHEDSELILRSVTEEALAKSRKTKAPGKSSYHSQENGTSVAGEVCSNMTCDSGASSKRLCDASDAELALELARRKAKRNREANMDQSTCIAPGVCALFN